MTTLHISQQQLESYLWGAAVLLRGTVDAGDYKQFIFPLLFYKRVCDVFDEETQVALKESGGDEEFAAYPENHRFQIPREAHWREARKAAKNVGLTLQTAMRKIETANPELYGIFGDAQWTNKERLSDAMLRDLVEHFSSFDLTLANLPEDELGIGYEFLIKKFADDSGHTAAEFYTNRSVVHLMTEMLEPQPGESIYDPTCGSGGMLLSCIAHLRRRNLEWRNVHLYGQERNLMTSSIARMNCFLHGIEDFQIIRGDTLSEPKFVKGDHLMQFDVVLANPPYSIKQWDRDFFASDPWGRNLYGTPPQGRADYAFWQHILCSLAPKSGRCAILFPHGVLFRQEEAEMRRKLVESDVVECVLGLGPDLFYNATMEACVVICRTAKPKARRGRILFINAINELARERSQSFLTKTHIQRIVTAYRTYRDEAGFATVASLEQVRKNNHSLKIDLYAAIQSAGNGNGPRHKHTDLQAALAGWNDSCIEVRNGLSSLLPNGHKPAPRVEKLQIKALEDIHKQFAREKWTRVRFGDVVEFEKESVDPDSGEVERYVAGDHMDTENVHIRRWGIVGDGYLGPAFIRRFRKGQVLYGSRRTYLKKVAYAGFDGVTANTTFVLEAVKGKLHQPLLPWLMLSEKFTEHSIRESKGSTNPYINFPDIAKFEFDLPPLDEQRRIAEVLWSLDDALQSVNRLHSSLLTARDVFFDDELDRGTRAEPETLLKLGYALSDIVAGSSPKASSNPASEGEFGVLKVSAVGDGVYREEENKALLDAADFNPTIEVKAEMILVTRCNAVLSGIGRACLVEKTRPGLMLSDKTLQLVPKADVIEREFLIQGLRREPYRGFVERSANGTEAKNISQDTLRASPFWIPSLKKQNEIVSRLKSFNAGILSASQDSRNLSQLRDVLINSVTS